MSRYAFHRFGRTQAIQLTVNKESIRSSWVPLVDEAIKRAAVRARAVAMQTNTGILVMIDGKMVKIGAEELRAERDA